MIHVLTVFHQGEEIDETPMDFKAATKAEALKKLRSWLMKLPNDSLEIKVSFEYKEYRKLTAVEGGYEIDININGAGETAEFRDRKKAIERFVDICSENGEHWDTESGKNMLTVDLAKLKTMLTAWHEDEVTDSAEAREYAVRLIKRMKEECKP